MTDQTSFHAASAAGTFAGPRARRPRIGLRSRVTAISRPRPELLGLIVLSALLYLWSLSRNGWANDYYSAAVRSMSTSWHNFLYASFDPSGVMTVDKGPLALWVQALSVRVFGYHALSVLVPQALMGVGAVVLIYDLVRRRFGRLAGAVAGLVLALTPITVAISRHNNPDALLVLCSVAALWFLVRGLEDGRTRWLVLSGVAVGLGFETKMAVALMVVPAIAAAWIWVAPRGRMHALRQLAAGGAAMAVVGLAWPLLVALTPPSSRPWISGTSDNSIWSLIFGYNGLGRIDGQAGGPGAIGGGGGAGGNFGGSPGLLRLLNQSVGGQAGWLLGFAVVAGIAVVVSSKLARSDGRSGWLIAVGGSFLTTAVAFSVAQGIFHPYYVSLLAPFTAALVGAGVVELRHANTPRLLAPLAVAAGVTTELIVLGNQPGDLTWWRPLLVAGGVVAIAGLVASFNGRVRSAALATGIAVLLIAPAIWSVQTLGHPTNGTFPAGGPVTAAALGGPGGGGGRAGGGFPGAGAAGGAGGGFPGGGGAGGGFPRAGGAGSPPAGAPGGGGAMFGGNANLTQVLSYIRAHGGGTLAVSSQTGASSAIIQSGADVAGIGGFSGRESAVTVSWLAQAVQSGQIRWVLTDGSGGAGFGHDSRTGSSAAMAAVAKVCKAVPSSALSNSGSTSNNTTSGTLYDCQGSAAALLAQAG